jgi:CheY-like chemotaxis protein
VLLADGDALSAECMTLLLELDGHQVEVARTGSDALHMALADPPDVFLLEIRLPLIDGWEVVRQLKTHPTVIRPLFIALTSCGSPVDRRRSEEAGIDLHLLKPIDSRYLRSLLKRFQTILLPAGEVHEPPIEALGSLWPALA